MELLGEPPIKERQKSFNVAASVNMMSYDLERFGHVKPKTRERVCDEELSILAEGVGRAACTSFNLQRQGNQLMYFDRGEWKPYTQTLLTGLDVANREAINDPRREFLAHRAAADLAHGYKLRDLKPGQQHAWFSHYPQKAEELYGEQFVKSCGFLPERKMGFLYRAECKEDGSVTLESQTVDNSELDAFGAVMSATENDPGIDMDAMTRTYDGTLKKKYGGYFFAGKRDAEMDENAWDSIRQHRDLIEYHINGLERIAAMSLNQDELEDVTKKHIYGVWAAFKNRIDYGTSRPQVNTTTGHSNTSYIPVEAMNVRNEVRRAFNEFANDGKVLVGCGGSIAMAKEVKDVMDASADDVFDSIFGKSKSEKYDFDKNMFCVSCQAPPKKGDSRKNCGPCGLCRVCDKQAGGKG